MTENFNEILEKYGLLTYTNKGRSMMPMLRPGRDVFTIAKKPKERLKENDVILFCRDGRYILHRIVEVFEDHYTALGDNTIGYENNVTDDEILGVLISFQRNGKNISVNDLRYRIYVVFVRLFEKPRILLKRIKSRRW